MLREIDYYARMAYGVYQWLHYPPIRDHAALLAEQMAQRESRFLDLARRIVFSNPQHPYHQMFRLAGCGYEDLARSVGSQGLEAALSSLAAQGVFLTHDEFKGKTPIVRAGQEISSTPGSWSNPLARGHLEGRSGGSRSSGTSTRYSPQSQVYREVYEDLVTREFELARRVRLHVGPILPSNLAMADGLRLARVGLKLEQWFTMPGGLREEGHYRAVTHLLVRLARVLGAPLPFPTNLPPNDFTPVAQWIARSRQEGRPCVLRGSVSPAVRVAAAARDAGLDIAGTIFLVGSEALTEAKRATIEAVGCTVYPRYSISEIGAIGFACRQMRSDCVHLFRDSVAVVSRVRRAPLTEIGVNSLLFTTLLPSTPWFLINVEMDDAGILEPATCQCQFSAAGMNLQVRGIFSYGKLTGQGITLYGTDVLHVLEHTLPGRFGGAAGDYQLVESEGTGQTQLVLRVSPRVGNAAIAEVREFFLAEIRRCYGGSLATRLWRHSAGFEVVVQEPAVTPSGKVLPLHVLGSEDPRVHAT